MTLPNPTLAPSRERISESPEAPVSVPTKEVTEADVLLRAADLLEEFGWCQIRWGSKDQGVMCADQTIREASQDFGGSGWGKHFTAAGRVFREAHGDCPMVFNDTPGRTKAEVTAALRSAALSGVQ